MGLNDANLRFYWEILPLLSPEIVGQCVSASRFPLEVHHYSAIPPCPTRLLTARPPLPHSYVRLPTHPSLLDEQTTSLSRQNPRFHHLLSQGLYKSRRLLLKNAQLSRKTRGLSRESPRVFYSLLRKKWPNSSIGDKKHCFTDLFSTANVFKPHHARLRVSACLIKTGLVFSRNNRPSASPSQPGTRQTPPASVSHAFSGRQPPSTAKTAPLPSFYRLKALYIREKSLFLHIFRVREAVRLCSPLTNRTL